MTLRYFAMIADAIAAARVPWPPNSIITATTIFASFGGREADEPRVVELLAERVERAGSAPCPSYRRAALP